MVGKKRRFWLAGNREPEQDIFFVEALDPAIWEAGDEENWDTCWYTGMPGPDVFGRLDGAKTINHIPGNNGLTVKNYLFETLSAASDRLADQSHRERMAFFPRVYAMPEDYIDLQQAAARHPDKRWILKPKNSSRGRGIEVIRDVAAIPMEKRWLVQEYIDNPHLMNARKYVLRLYVLVTSVNPLLVYFYQEGFAKLASEPYDPGDPDNPFSNLTNPDINAANEDVETPVEFVGLSDYRKWLRAEGRNDEALFEKIRDLLVQTVISVRDKMRTRTRSIHADTSGCYELLGIDCLIDADLKPWILECNLSPSLDVCASPEHGGIQEEKTKRQLVADMVSLVGINEPIVEQTNIAAEDRIRERADCELARAGAFQRIFPAEDVEDYLPVFPIPRYADIVLARRIAGRQMRPLKLTPKRTIEIVSEDDLALYAQDTGTLYAPNASASWIWLKTIDGADPEDIAQELIASHIAAHGALSPDEEWTIRENIWDVLADWATLGLIRRDDGQEASGTIEDRSEAPDWAGTDQVAIGEKKLELKYGCPAVAKRLRQTLKPLMVGGDVERSIAIQHTKAGYAVAIGPRLVAVDLGLAQIAPVVCRLLFEHAPAAASEIAMAGAFIPIGDGEAVFVVSTQTGGWDGLAASLAHEIKASVSGGIRFDVSSGGAGAPLGLPIRIDEDDVAEIETALGHPLTRQIHQWSGGGEGRMLTIDRQRASMNRKIRAIIIPTRQEQGAAALRPASPHAALSAVLSSCVGPRVRLSCAAASKLSDWLAGRKLWAIEFSDFKDAAALLAARIAER